MSERNIRRYDNSMFRAITTLLRGSLNDMLLAFSGRIPSSAIPRHVRHLIRMHLICRIERIELPALSGGKSPRPGFVGRAILVGVVI